MSPMRGLGSMATLFLFVVLMVTPLWSQTEVPSADSLPVASQKGTEEMDLQKETFRYVPGGRKDPFLPIFTGGAEKAGLNINNLVLVGILWGEDGWRALVKEKGGVGHVLKPNDKVAGGKVAEVQEDRVVFELVHFGITTRAELTMGSGE
jgi:Tfp pilus assembly protein PilP